MKIEEFESLKNGLIEDGTIQPVEFGNCIQGDKIFVKDGVYNMSRKKVESLIEIANIQRYYQCNPVRFIKDFFNIELLDAQAWIVQQSWTCKNVLLTCSRGFGKALSLDTRIPTPDGDKTIKDIEVGDYVYGDNGRSARVVNTSPIFYNHNCYEITFSDGEKIIADADHLWGVYKHHQKRVIRTEEIARSFRKKKKASLYQVDICSPIEYMKEELIIDPYVLGLWLGSGIENDDGIIINKSDFSEIKFNIEDAGYSINSVENVSSSNRKIEISDSNGIPLLILLDETNLINNKHIPGEYQFGSTKQRYSLLQGIMDAVGIVSKRGGKCTLSQSGKHYAVVEDVIKILDSLGVKNILHKIPVQNGKSWNYEIVFYSCKDASVFRLPKKKKRLRDNLPKSAMRKSIVDIKKVDSVPTKCLMVDNDSHLFLCGEKNTVTHNSTLIDIIIMAKDMLFNNYWSYIASGSGSQAETTFTTLERLANDNIDSFMGSTGSVFKNEIEVKNASGDGFSHSSDGFNYSTYNGSTTKTLNSNVDKKRGIFKHNIFICQTHVIHCKFFQLKVFCYR